MIIKSLKLKNFRNYEKQELTFSENKNLIFGKNGQGKTNIIEALYFMQSGKSYRCSKDSETIRFGAEYARIEAEFVRENRKNNVVFFLSDKKSIKLNGILLERLSELVGEINIVIFTPDYLSLIKDGPSQRRQFLDSFISQIKPVYFKTLIAYHKVLKQRNNLLKSRRKDLLSTLDIWDRKLSEYGAEIAKMRDIAIDRFNETVNLINNSGDKTEKIKLLYLPGIKGDFKDKEVFLSQLISQREKDMERGITTVGPHRDDFEIFMNGINIRKYGSQGQMRSCVLKLKLSECEIIKEKTGEEPVLLLDDILSELDEERRRFFLENIKGKQVFITCTDREEFDDDDCFVFRVEDGSCQRIQ